MPENEIALLSETTETELLDAVAKCHVAAGMKNDTIKSLRLAAGMNQLRQVLHTPEVKNLIMGFQNIPIGFLTDSKQGYGDAIVLNAALEALTAGAYLHGNEFNIIAGRAYFAQNFFVRKVREYCAANKVKRHFEYSCEWLKKVGKQDEFCVTATIGWKFEHEEEKNVVKEKYHLLGVSRDQVIGKAKKRAHQWLYNELTDNNYALSPDDSNTFDMEDEADAGPGKPSFDANPDPIEYLCKKYSIGVVKDFLEAQGLQPIPATDGTISVSEEISTMITGNIADFERQIKEFSEL